MTLAWWMILCNNWHTPWMFATKHRTIWSAQSQDNSRKPWFFELWFKLIDKAFLTNRHAHLITSMGFNGMCMFLPINLTKMTYLIIYQITYLVELEEKMTTLVKMAYGFYQVKHLINLNIKKWNEIKRHMTFNKLCYLFV